MGNHQKHRGVSGGTPTRSSSHGLRDDKIVMDSSVVYGNLQSRWGIPRDRWTSKNIVSFCRTGICNGQRSEATRSIRKLSITKSDVRVVYIWKYIVEDFREKVFLIIEIPCVFGSVEIIIEAIDGKHDVLSTVLDIGGGSSRLIARGGTLGGHKRWEEAGN